MNPSDLKQQLAFIQQAGYQILEHSQPGRFVIGTAKKAGITYLFKISPPDPDLIKRLQRQVSFDQLIGSFITKTNPKPPLRLPRVFETNFPKQENWAIFEHFTGDLLANWTPKRNPKQLSNRLTDIADILIFFDNLDSPQIKLVNDPPYEDSINDHLISLTRTWSQNPLAIGLLTESELESLINLIKAAPILIGRLQHGDFVPWHMFDLTDGKIGLIDSEAASIHKPRFYDVAYFYHRVFTKLWQPDLAKKFLQTFLKNSSINKEQFFNQFLPIIAQRNVGGMFDYARADQTHDDSQKTEQQLHRQLLELILQKDLNSLLP